MFSFNPDCYDQNGNAKYTIDITPQRSQNFNSPRQTLGGLNDVLFNYSESFFKPFNNSCSKFVTEDGKYCIVHDEKTLEYINYVKGMNKKLFDFTDLIEVFEKFTLMPLYFGKTVFGLNGFVKDDRPIPRNITSGWFEISGTLKEHQTACLVDVAKNLQLQKDVQTAGIIKLPPSGGKTFLGIYLIQALKLPTLIVVPKRDGIIQWISEFIKFTNINTATFIKIGKNRGNFKGFKIDISKQSMGDIRVNEWNNNQYGMFDSVLRNDKSDKTDPSVHVALSDYITTYNQMIRDSSMQINTQVNMPPNVLLGSSTTIQQTKINNISPTVLRIRPEDGHIYFVVNKTLTGIDNDVYNFLKSKIGAVMMDEISEYPTPIGYRIFGYLSFARFIFGLSGTPLRNDRKDLIPKAYIGDILHDGGDGNINLEVHKIIYNNPDIFLRKTEQARSFGVDKNGNSKSSDIDFTATIDDVVSSPVRGALVIEIINLMIRENRNILVISDRVEHIQTLHNIMLRYNVPCGIFLSNASLKDVSSQRNKRVIFITTKIMLGLNLPDIDTMILATSYKPKKEMLTGEYNGNDMMQLLKRIRDGTHKNKPILIDICDWMVSTQTGRQTQTPFFNHSKLRDSFYYELNLSIKTSQWSAFKIDSSIIELYKAIYSMTKTKRRSSRGGRGNNRGGNRGRGNYRSNYRGGNNQNGNNQNNRYGNNQNNQNNQGNQFQSWNC